MESTMADIFELPLPERDDTDQPFMDSVDRQTSQERMNQRGVLDDLKSGFNQTALAAGIRRGNDEGTAALEQYNLDNPLDRLNNTNGRTGLTTGQIGAKLKGVGIGLIGGSFDDGSDTDNEANFDALTADIPRDYHSDIMDGPTFDAQTRTRARILDQLEAQRMSAIQWDGGGLELIGSLVDVDIVLNFGSGGMVGAAKIARATKMATSSSRVAGVAQGITGGAQAGLTVGAYDLLVRETADESSFVAAVIGGAALGGTFGVIGGDMSRSLHDLEVDYAQRVETGHESLIATNETADVVGPALPFEKIDPEQAAPGSTVFPEIRVIAPSRESADQATGPSTVGAAQVGDAELTAPVNPALVDMDVSPEVAAITANSVSSNHTTGFNDRKASQQGFLDKALASSWNTVVGAGFQARMYSSESPTMNWLGHAVYESASGLNRGVSTSATLVENYHARIQTQLLPVHGAMTAWAKRNDAGAFGSGFGISQEGVARFNRDVMLERNAREHGYARSTDEDIIRASDAYDSAARDSLAIGKGRDDQHAVRGMQDVADNPHYTPYVWSGSKINALISSGRVTRANIISAVAEGYRKAGMAAGKDADAVAEAVIRRTEINEAEIDSSVHSLLQADGKEFLRESLQRSGMSEVEVESLMKRLGVAAENRGKEGFAKSRNDIDMYTDILTEAEGATDSVKIVDLLSNDMAGDWQRYTRRIAGSAALARQGITSRAARKDVISAIQSEQRALGETLTPKDELNAMFTNFDGGAVKGWSKAVNGTAGPQSAGPLAALAKRMTNLAWLNKIGLTQLGETAATIHMQGAASFLRRSGIQNFRDEIKAGNKELLDEMAYLVGEIGQDQHLFSQHLNLDEVSALDGADLLSKMNKFASSASYVQGYTSMFNQVRGWQQKTAALGTMDKVFRTLKAAQDAGEELSPIDADRMWRHLGLDAETLNRLDQLILDGTIEFSPEGFVNRLNVDSWEGSLRDNVGSSVTRNINQVVQKSMAGEQDSWMHNGAGSVLTHLKTFPMGATHKQFARHFRNNDPAGLALTAISIGTAGIASVLREGLDQAGGSEREWMTTGEHAKRAFGYSNMTGFLPMVHDPLMTIMGLEDYRINQFGSHSEIAPPILSFANDALRLPGALVKAATGNADYDDKKALRTLPFANTILVGEMFTSMGQAD